MNSLQLLRIEHKLDLVLHALKGADICIPHLPQLSEIGQDICPVCEDDIKFSIDITSETYVRSCGCRAPIPIVPGISAVMTPPPPSSSKDNDNGSEPTEAPGEG